MSQQSPNKVLDRILNYPHKEKGCSYICGPHLPFRAAIPDRWKHVVAYIPHPIPPYEKKPENG